MQNVKLSVYVALIRICVKQTELFDCLLFYVFHSYRNLTIARKEKQNSMPLLGAEQGGGGFWCHPCCVLW